MSYKQSFIYLLADDIRLLPSKFWIIKFSTNIRFYDLTTINDIKKIFLSNLTIDKFIKSQNGILIDIFSNDKKVNTKKYKNLSSKIKDRDLLEKIVGSFENFKNYINDSNENIDYKFIWDFVCKPINEGVLFDKGINLIIFKHPDNDLTDKIDIICPKNYSSNDFLMKKKTLLVFNRNNYFEPLCKVIKKRKTGLKNKTTYQITKFFYKKRFCFRYI